MGRYPLAAGHPELERLRVQSTVWESAGRELLWLLRPPPAARAAEIGCGPVGWLPLLSEWVGPSGSVVGSDVQRANLEAAEALIAQEGLANVAVVLDDLFDSRLPQRSFDLVHARFQIAPLGRAADQVAGYLRLCKKGGWVILEDPDPASWHFNPPAPAAEELIGWLERAFAESGGDLAAGRRLPALLADCGLRPAVRAQVLALTPGHPYLSAPLLFAESLDRMLRDLLGHSRLRALRAEAAHELADTQRWGTTFTLVQAWARTGLS